MTPPIIEQQLAALSALISEDDNWTIPVVKVAKLMRLAPATLRKMLCNSNEIGMGYEATKDSQGYGVVFKIPLWRWMTKQYYGSGGPK